MDFLLDALDEIAARIFDSVAHLLNLDVDIVFVDTTSTYWEVEGADELADLSPEPEVDDGIAKAVEGGARRFGNSKDHRDDLPQVVIAMAVTRDGIPVRCWTFPGNTGDQKIIRTVKDDLGAWNLRRLVWVADAGFASAANRAYLTRGGGHYIHAEKLRHTNTEAAAALARPGRYHTVADNLRVKEVWVAPGGGTDDGARAERFVVCHNPEAADRDAAVRERLIEHLEGLIAGSDAWPDRRRDELVGSLKAKPGLRGCCAAPRPGCCASTAPPRNAKPTTTASGCCAPPISPSPPRTWPPPTSSCSPSSAAGATARARSGCARSTTTARTASAPTSNCAGWHCCSSGSPKPAPATPGATCATNSTACTWSPWPPPTAASPNAPPSPAARRPSSPPSTCPNRPATSTSHPAPTLPHD